ncbi:bifunctional ADP-dependent NAD(P)H-hydrate dehydratase/NAD(P)H-hydrate epimerase [Butyrivibrio sp. FCS014]|uniref:bifunctional ADP-dependent NAD(P)H-hydrate dehydratase/NAD(P)H-hydrate epimerase n=1 Tax=Butyrivibrio sp. FCS014 TaxID=1408304 RepID=UPI000463029E|nr:bifunctional ADP-dependent NAD(P)H-hydrate dehydratase/NAD(P)H-hydrate epimerase [Butyrivibrio sp. FCS014]
MRFAVTSQEMKICDRNTAEYFGIGTAVLMERASLAIADEIIKWKESRGADRQYSVLVLAGVGNNGGDGVCAGRILAQKNFNVTNCVIGNMTKCSDLMLKQLSIAGNYAVPSDTFSNIRDNKRPSDFDIIIDAMFGIGLSRPLTGDSLEAVSFIEKCKKERGSDLLVISVDIPSGINADNGQVMGNAVKADKTVTFNFTKLGHLFYPGCEYSGEVIIRDVGITIAGFLDRTPGFIWYDGEPAGLLPERKKDGNKGTNGKVLIVAGSKDISGACILSASAALRTGAGMVRIFTASENAEAVKTLLPEALLDVYEDFEPIEDKLGAACKWSTQAVLGPGIGTLGKGRELVSNMLRDYDKSLVVDADALNLIAEDSELMELAGNYCTDGKKMILTPHLGEFARLFNCSVKECKEHITQYPAELAKRMHATVICKDARSIVADGNEKRSYINVSGNDGMATAGSGDVLSGVLGALLNDEMTGFEVACAGVYIHGRAGDAAAEKLGKYAVAATDIVEAISKVLH